MVLHLVSFVGNVYKGGHEPRKSLINHAKAKEDSPLNPDKSC